MPDEKCDKKVVFYAPSARIGGNVRPPSCIPNVKKQGQELREPVGTPEQEVQLQTPRAIALGNRPQTAKCEERGDGSEGYNVTVPDSTLTASVPFSTILAASASALDYIARNGIVDRIEEVQAAGALTEENLAELTLLPPSLAKILYESIQTSQSRLNASAKTLADSQLSCEWFNEAQTATCPDPSMAHSYEVAGAVYTVTIAARTISSLVSQEEANRIALAQANAALNCFYVSDPYTVTCLTRPDVPEGVTEPVPNDTEPVYPGLLPRKGTVSLEKGAYTSTYSKEAANQQAETAALSMLNCYYVNNSIFLQCSDPNARAHGVDPTKFPAIEADPITNKQGQKVSIPKGFVTSVLSTEDANYQAQLLAESLLTCCFMSPAMTVKCKPTPQLDIYGNQMYDDAGNPLYVQADEKASPVYSYELPAGMFTSCTSQAEVDAQAEAYIAGVLQCYYCNTVVEPTCVPDWVISASRDGILLERDITTPSGKTYKAGEVYKLPLPLDPHDVVNPYTGEIDDTSEWSQDATVGVSGGIVCGFDYLQMQQVAASLAGGLVSVARNDDIKSCYYGNDLLIAGCKFHDPYSKVIKHATAKYDTFVSQESSDYAYGQNPKGVVKYTALSLPQRKYDVRFVNGTSLVEEKELSDGTKYRVYRKDLGNISLNASRPAVDEYIVFPANFVMESANSLKEQGYPVEGYTEESIRHYVKQQVNEIVRIMADSMIYCVYGNPPTKVACDLPRINPYNVWGWYSRVIDTKRKRISYGYDDNRYAGNEINIIYKHPYWNMGAGKPLQNLAKWSPSSYNPIVLPADLITDKSYERVLTTTKALAESLMICMYGNDQFSCAGGGSGTCVDIGGGQVLGTYLLNNQTGGGGTSAVIQSMTVFAESRQQANKLAQSLCSSSASVPCFYTNERFECDCYTEWTTLVGDMRKLVGTDTAESAAKQIEEGMFVSTSSADVITQCTRECNVRCSSNLCWIMTNNQMMCECNGEPYPEAKRRSWICGSVHPMMPKSFIQIECIHPIRFQIPHSLFIGNVKTVPAMIKQYCTMMCRLAAAVDPCVPGTFPVWEPPSGS